MKPKTNKKPKASKNPAKVVEKPNKLQNLWAEYGKRLAKRELLTIQAEQLRLEAKDFYQQIQKLENK